MQYLRPPRGRSTTSVGYVFCVEALMWAYRHSVALKQLTDCEHLFLQSPDLRRARACCPTAASPRTLGDWTCWRLQSLVDADPRVMMTAVLDFRR